MGGATVTAFTTWGGWLLGFLAIVVPAVQQLRKGKIDESTLLLDKWKELAETVKAQAAADITRLTGEVQQLRAELEATKAQNVGLLRMLATYTQERPLQIGGPVPTQDELDILHALEKLRETRP
jgi:hypothetical protein